MQHVDFQACRQTYKETTLQLDLLSKVTYLIPSSGGGLVRVFELPESDARLDLNDLFGIRIAPPMAPCMQLQELTRGALDLLRSSLTTASFRLQCTVATIARVKLIFLGS